MVPDPRPVNAYHDDGTPSLSIGFDGGKAVLDCKAGCETEDVLKEVGLTMSDLFLDSFQPRSIKLKREKKSNGRRAASPNPEMSPWGPIEEVYPYEDEQAECCYEVCRIEGKIIRSRRRTESGQWAWNLKGVTRLPYRLPELLESDDSTTVFICEGEKDANALAATGLIATTNACGGNWTENLNEHFRGRYVVILPDNDTAGRKRGEKIAASVKVLHLEGLPSKGDVYDWLENGGTADKLQHLAGATDEWTPSPEDVEFKPFPTQCLPAPIRQFVAEAAASLGCDQAFLAVPILSVLASAIGNSRRIQLKKDWCEPCVIWTAILGDSGTLKTPALEKVLGPLHLRQRREADKHADRMERYEPSRAAYEKALRKH